MDRRICLNRREGWTEGEGEGTTELTQRLMGRLTGRLTTCEQQGVGVRFHMSLVMLTRRA